MKFPDDPQASGEMKYHASKLLAHRATHDWVEKNKPNFLVITIHPSFVYGRNLSQTSPDGIDGTNMMLWGSLYSEKPFIPATCVDVRDVALAHVRALEANVDGGKNKVHEFIVSASEKEGWSWTNIAKFVKEKYPNLGTKLEGSFDAPPPIQAHRAEQILGIKWRKMEGTISSFLDHQMELKAQL
jgi:nucleoside-diphosphate-sugar epimerase